MPLGRALLALWCSLAARAFGRGAGAASPHAPGRAPGRPSRGDVRVPAGAPRRSAGRRPRCPGALERAVALDPQSAELQAELGGVLRAAEQAGEAVAAAERAIALDANSEEGHRILGLVYAAWADGVADGPAGGSAEQWRATAIEHLTQGADDAGDGHRPGPAAHAGAPAARRRSGRQGRAAAGARRGPDGPGRRAAGDARRGPPFARAARPARRPCSSRRPRRIPATTSRSATSTSGSASSKRRPRPSTRAPRSMRTPGRELRLRRVAALAQHARRRRRRAGDCRRSPSSSRPLPRTVTALYLMAQAHPAARRRPICAVKAAEQALAVESGHLPSLAVLASIYRERYDYAAVDTLLGRLDSGDDARSQRRGPATRCGCLPSSAARGSSSAIRPARGARVRTRAQPSCPTPAGVAAALAQAHLQAAPDTSRGPRRERRAGAQRPTTSA